MVVGVLGARMVVGYYELVWWWGIRSTCDGGVLGARVVVGVLGACVVVWYQEHV